MVVALVASGCGAVPIEVVNRTGETVILSHEDPADSTRVFVIDRLGPGTATKVDRVEGRPLSGCLPGRLVATSLTGKRWERDGPCPGDRWIVEP